MEKSFQNMLHVCAKWVCNIPIKRDACFHSGNSICGRYMVTKLSPMRHAHSSRLYKHALAACVCVCGLRSISEHFPHPRASHETITQAERSASSTHTHRRHRTSKTFAHARDAHTHTHTLKTRHTHTQSCRPSSPYITYTFYRHLQIWPILRAAEKCNVLEKLNARACQRAFAHPHIFRYGMTHTHGGSRHVERLDLIIAPGSDRVVILRGAVEIRCIINCAQLSDIWAAGQAQRVDACLCVTIKHSAHKRSVPVRCTQNQYCH